MEIYFCSSCKNILGTKDEFEINYSRVKFSMRVGVIDNRGVKFIQKCSNCGSSCKFIEKKYPGDDFLEEKDYLFNPLKEKKTFNSDSVIRYRDLLRSVSKQEQKEIKSRVQKFQQKMVDEIDLKEHKRIEEGNKQMEKIKKQRQKESDEYWDNFIYKYPLFGISNWLFGKKETTPKPKKKSTKKSKKVRKPRYYRMNLPVQPINPDALEYLKRDPKTGLPILTRRDKIKVAKKKSTPKPKKAEKKKSNFGKQYYDLEEMLLGKNSSYIEEYGFIKLSREKLKSGEVYLEEMSRYIKDHHKKYDGGEIMTKTELYNQLEHIFTVYLEDWEKKKETTFVGFEDVEQYHSLSQKIVVELGDLLQEKIMELGK